ncbi:SLAP domain-containing protein [Lacticaseibacillus saniviri]
MKKSSIKYLGVTAAALLAVAPIAAPAAVASVAPQTVSASTSDASIAQAALTASVNANATIDGDTVSSADTAAFVGKTVSQATELIKNPIVAKALKSADGFQSPINDQEFTASIAGHEGDTAAALQTYLKGLKNGDSFTLTLNAVKIGTLTVLGTTNVVFKVATGFGATATNLTKKVYDVYSPAEGLTVTNLSSNAVLDPSEYKVEATPIPETIKDGDNYIFAKAGTTTQDVKVYLKDATDAEIANGTAKPIAETTRTVTVAENTDAKYVPVFQQNGKDLAEGASFANIDLPGFSEGDPAYQNADAIKAEVATQLANIGDLGQQAGKQADGSNSSAKFNSTTKGFTYDSSNININVPGVYNVKVSFTNGYGQTATAYIPVRVYASNAPAVIWDGNQQNITAQPGKLTLAALSKDGYTFYQNRDEAGKGSKGKTIDASHITVDFGNLDVNKVGTYQIKYTATNDYGKTLTVYRTVTISDNAGSEVNETGTVYVNYVPGYGIAVWNTYQDGRKITGTKLQHGTAWKYYKTATINGEKWYNLGGDQWIQAQYTSATKPGNTGSEIEKIDGTVKVNYVPGYGIAIWGKPAADVTSKKLAHGTTWKVFAKTSVNGTTWYNLGGNQWVDGTYAKLQ